MVVAAPSLVPELLVADLSKSLEFWSGLLGFAVEYERPDEGFAYLALANAHIMLEQQGVGRNWVTGALERPLGRGVNFQITVDDIETIVDTLRAASYPLFMEPETKHYRLNETRAAVVKQFLVADPDGYLVRIQQSVGIKRMVR